MDASETILIWRCIGCGSMGNLAECTGDCALGKLEIVGAMEHAEALFALEDVAEQEGRLVVLLDAIGRAATEDDPETTYRALQAQARVIAQSAADESGCEAGEKAEPSVVWLCKTCGQIEASVPCIGVCVRRNEEVVRASDHAAVVTKLAETAARVRLMRRIAVSLAHVTPKAGQWRAALDALRNAVATVPSADTHARPNAREVGQARPE